MNENTDDTNALQGLWKVESITSRGGKVGYSVTHWEFDGNRIKEIIPHYVDGGAWGTFAVNAATTPKHLELSRYTGPRPQTKQASGTRPVESAVLGTVTWNDNQTVWDATVAFAPEQIVRVSLEPLEADEAQTISNGERLVEWAKTHEAEIRAYAATQMTDLAEDWREDDDEPDPITPPSFAARITLEAISGEANGGASFWYNDDEIFAGHVIVVSVNADREFTNAQMMG